MNTALRAIEAGSASDGLPRDFLIVLDAGQFSTRCRCCRWRSPSCPALTVAQTAFLTHVCPPAQLTIGRDRQRCQAPVGRRERRVRRDVCDPPRRSYGG